MPVASLWVASPTEISSIVRSSEGRRQENSKSLHGSWSSNFIGGFNQRKYALKFFFESSSLKTGNYGSFRVLSSLVVNPPEEMTLSSEKRIYDVVLRQASLLKEKVRPERVIDSWQERTVDGNLDLLVEAYERCGEICAEYAKTFYLGTLLMTPERRRAIWAIYVIQPLGPITQSIKWSANLTSQYSQSFHEPISKKRTLVLDIRFKMERSIIFLQVWCRRTDELVDGPNAAHVTPTALDRWGGRLNDLFEGRPYDMLDAALADTVSKFPVDIQPFKDMIEGMRMDLKKSRYMNFDELYLYCYYVAGTVGLMSVPVMGIDTDSQMPTEKVYSAALALGIANQLTNILRDVGEDARRGRIYLPQDELAQAGLSDEDIFAGKVTDKWRIFMKQQIERARKFFADAEEGVSELSPASRWPVWASLLLYRQILDAIEANDYNNFTKRAYVKKSRKLLFLPTAYVRAMGGPSKHRSLGQVYL